MVDISVQSLHIKCTVAEYFLETLRWRLTEQSEQCMGVYNIL